MISYNENFKDRGTDNNNNKQKTTQDHTEQHRDNTLQRHRNT